jgi:transcriptional regulator with XRE-family HTH domain
VANIGDRLRYLIHERGLEQKQFAELLGLKVSTLNGYVTNYRNPDTEMHKRLADFFGVSVDYLIGRTDERDSEKHFRGTSLELIKGSMTYEELSLDIVRSLSLSSRYYDIFSPEYLENIAKERITPNQQRVSLLSAYAGVREEFFYTFNTLEDLKAERTICRKTSHTCLVSRLSGDIYEFVMDPMNEKYIRLAVDIKSKGIDPEDIVSFSLRYR